jgi:hypothetical protein
MARDMAKAVSQQFMEARLIENATDPSSNEFKDRGLYVLTPKGLHILERFISRNGVNGDHLAHVFATQPVCMKLLHLKRRSVDDEIIVSQSVINTLFRRFAGRQANEQNQPMDPTAAYYDRGKGIELMDVTDRPPTSFGKSQVITHRFCFAALVAIEWLCDFVSVVDREEAAEIAAQFVRFGLITFVSDKQKNNESAFIVTVRGSVPGGNSTVTVCVPLSYSFNLRWACDDRPLTIISFRKRVTSDAPPKQFTRLRKKGYELPVGTWLELPASATRVTVRQPT